MSLAELNALGRVDVTAPTWQGDTIKELPGARYDSRRGVWTMPLSWPTCLQLRSTLGKDLTVGPELARWSKREVSERVQPSLDLRTEMDGPGDPDDFPHVRAGAAWLAVAGDCLLTDDMGGGKTHQAVDAMQGVAGPHLVVTTKSMLWTWKDECERWWPGCRVSVASGTAAARKKAILADHDVCVITWQSLMKHSRLASYGSHRLSDSERTPKELNSVQWGTVVADEVHRAKSPKAKWTRALWAVGDQALRRLGLTGTPVVNNVDELWCLLRFVAPYEWADHGRYQKRYCDTSWTGWGLSVVGLKPANQIEFRRATDPRWRRVPAAVFRGERAEPVHEIVPLELEPKQLKLYKEWAAKKPDDVDPLTKATRLWQIASSSLDDDLAPEMPSNKVHAVLDILEDYDEQVVVFAHHARLIGLLASQLKEGTFGEVSGRVPSDVDRQRYMKRFQDGDLRVMLCTYGAGSEGIKLTAARLMVAMQDTWSNMAAQQAVARLDRPGQSGDVVVRHLQSRGTIDRVVVQRAKQKGFQLESFVQDQDRLAALLRTEEE